MATDQQPPLPHAGTPARSRKLQTLYFIIGIVITVMLGLVARRFWPQPKLPEGWLRLTPPNDVMALVEVRGQVWSGGRDGLVALDPDQGTLIGPLPREDEGPAIRYVADMVTSSDGAVWVAHLDGVSRYDGERWRIFTEADGVPGGRALALLSSRDGTLWVGTEQGLARYVGGGWERVDTPQNDPAVSYLFEDSRGRIWAGAGFVYEGGVSVYENGAWHALDVDAHLPHPMLNTMLEDDEGQLWFGTGFSAYGGLAIYDGTNWRTLTTDDGLAGAKVRYLFQDAAGIIWVGSEYNGILRMDPDGRQILTPEEGLAGWEVKAMLQDSRGDLWLGTEVGLTRLNHEAWLRLGELGP